MKKEKTKINYKSAIVPLLISVIISIVIAISSFAINDSPFYKSFETVFQRAFFIEQNKPVSIYGESPYLRDFALIEIDERTLNNLKTGWPIPRSYYAQLIKKLASVDTKLICFDIIFPDKSKSAVEDEAFALQIKKTPNVLLAYHMTDMSKNPENKKDAEIIFPCEVIFNALGKDNAEKFEKLGFVSTDEDIDGLIRSVKLVQPYKDKLYTSFNIKILLKMFNYTPNEITPVAKKQVLLIKDKVIPINKNYNMNINFGFTPKNRENMPNIISMSDVFEMPENDLKAFFNNKIVLIGVTAMAGYDVKYFPVGQMPGTYGHMNALFTILNDKFIKQITPLKETYWILFFGILVGLASILFKPRYSLILLIVLLALSIFISYKIFVNNCIFMPMFPNILNVVLVFVSVNLYKYQQEQHAKKKLSIMIREFAPLPPEYLEKVIAEKAGSAQFGGKKVKLTILFSDIRGYTNLSEKLDPVEVMNTLNEYHGAMGEIFERNGGVIFDYQGDAQMVVFGLVEPSKDDHAFYAVKSGVEMQERVKQLVEKWGRKHEFEIGVGVCTGDVSLGIVGSAQRKQYAAIGDSTNVSARLQGMSKQLESPVLISDTAYEMCKDKIISDKLEPVSLKGKSEPLQVYMARGIK